jgi:hypothetical protein
VSAEAAQIDAELSASEVLAAEDGDLDNNGPRESQTV